VEGYIEESERAYVKDGFERVDLPHLSKWQLCRFDNVSSLSGQVRGSLLSATRLLVTSSKSNQPPHTLGADGQLAHHLLPTQVDRAARTRYGTTVLAINEDVPFLSLPAGCLSATLPLFWIRNEAATRSSSFLAWIDEARAQPSSTGSTSFTLRRPSPASLTALHGAVADAPSRELCSSPVDGVEVGGGLASQAESPCKQRT
jgi:hypothetical protein